MNETTNPIALVTIKYRKDKDMTYRAFAGELGAKTVNLSISHASIMNWEKGMTEPGTDFLLRCLVIHEKSDWRHQYAIDCLQAKLPDVFERVNGSIRILT
jgi:transcriptional regulator with XRE-family HTH domain